MKQKKIRKKIEERDQMEKWGSLLAAFGLLAAGIMALAFPELLYEVILNVTIFYLVFQGVYRLFQALKTHTKKIESFVVGALSLLFGIVLIFYSFLPEWIIRVGFGFYCLMVSLALFIQIAINVYNQVHLGIGNVVFGTGYFVVAILVLWTPRVSTEMLMRLFGAYFLLLSLRFFLDAFDMHSSHYRWQRRLHISLPTLIAALVPEYTLSQLNNRLQKEEDRIPMESRKKDADTRLKAMVHIGPDGFQKVGHFTFAFDGIVYSYGNYDASSGRLNGLMGDGVYFNVPLKEYLENIVRYEHNTIFEYGIVTNDQQDEQIQKSLEQLANRSYRWYCDLEKNNGKDNFPLYEKDYPSRLHMRTGAKFYKLKSGHFKTYWVTGDNCVSFADKILGMVGADVLSIRGIITPGTYFDYLQQEYNKENSPVVECIIHPWREAESQ